MICILSFIFLTTACHAKSYNLTQEQMQIKNFGFSYCLTKFNSKPLSDEASKAMGGYFQKGNHDENAYKNIKEFINNYVVNDNNVYKDTNDKSILMTCLDLYNLKEYNDIVKKQDKFIFR
ncbi:hypothetical protein F2A31_04400 [Acinetobacter suaedae]|uniref:Type VI secretion protein n=1 Tax=Acinetobacter suaedae TaxID=2609668 RepID=A0A5P1UWI9_9GAMM|nr:hypothetical protein F2A31_04400 [Acinetobacter sp. C16S1]